MEYSEIFNEGKEKGVVQPALFNALRQAGLHVETEYKVGRKSIDAMVTFGGVRLPVEVKPQLGNASNVANGCAQASDYADKLNHPVFLGPFPYLAKSQQDLRALRIAMLRFNVGFLFWDGLQKFAFYVGEQPIAVIGDFGPDAVYPDKIFMRNKDGSKKKKQECYEVSK